MRPTFCLLTLLALNAAAIDPLVQLDYASYHGRVLKSGVTQWLGIPYAAPPVGQLRFAAPRDVNVKNKEYQADSVRLSLFSLVFREFVNLYPGHDSPVLTTHAAWASLYWRTDQSRQFSLL